MNTKNCFDMLVEFGKKCPAFDYRMASVSTDSISCKYCRGNRGIYNNGVDCGFSNIPTSEAKFKVGELVYYRGLRYEIRKVYWDGRFEWQYIFKRERNPHAENTIFLTRQESEKHEIVENLKQSIKRMRDYCERYSLPFGPELKKLL